MAATVAPMDPPRATSTTSYEKRKAGAQLREEHKKRLRLAKEAPNNMYMRCHGMRGIPNGTRKFLEMVKSNRDRSPFSHSRSGCEKDMTGSSGSCGTDAGQRRSVPMSTGSGDGPASDVGFKSVKGSQLSCRTSAACPGTKRIILEGPHNLEAWRMQMEATARELGCHQELLTSPPCAHGTSTIEDWTAKQRVGMAFNLIWHHITPQVCGYMRVLGFNRIGGKDAAETYRKAQWAAERIPLVQAAKQSSEEVERMAMILSAMADDDQVMHYPTKEYHHKARAWFEKMLRRRAKIGDRTAADWVQTLEQLRAARAAETLNWEDRPSSADDKKREMKRPTSLAVPVKSPPVEQPAEIETQHVPRDEESRHLPTPIDEPGVTKPQPPRLDETTADVHPSSSRSTRYPTPVDEADVKPEPPE